MVTELHENQGSGVTQSKRRRPCTWLNDSGRVCGGNNVTSMKEEKWQSMDRMCWRTAGFNG